MTTVDWSDLTADQARQLLLCAAPEIDAGAELLNFDLSFNRDLTTYLDASTGDVEWNGDAKVHRDCSITLATQLDWGIALVRLFQIETDTATGLSARRNLGVFCLTAPDEPLGEFVVDDAGAEQPSYAVTGQDRLYLLDRQVGFSYVVLAGTNVLDAVAQVFTDAGLPGVQIDTAASLSTVPTTMTWALVPTNETASDPVTLLDGTEVEDSGPTTWLRVVNDLLSLIAYRGVFCDEDGYYCCSPYIDPVAVPSQSTFDADAEDSTVAVNRTVTRNLWASPNQWIFLQSNLDPSVVPTVGAGIYEVTNQSDGPSSIDARNGLVWPTQITLTAATQADLVTQGDARVAADKRGTVTFKVSTAPYPPAGHFDVFTLTDQRLPGGEAKVRATSWKIPLNGGDVDWGMEQIA